MFRRTALVFGLAAVTAVLALGGVATGTPKVARVCMYALFVICSASMIWGLAAGRRTFSPR
ncbi:MAG: hypothetical protein HYY17_10100 [Planctomycetes bacterium]|nr:hypothetical protein [Planctomycetota bacterium]